ncbi:methyltransferase domain-containing protein [Caldichromatium japonicum]|uniref:Methyltransferase domain-containing protein n=1 Tax=Caldichromatium japonicum TaxID=2699430 RepID=A0A6G7VAB3_9GAMM|nr:class I SAM-dependent methyltransferase [Caldichromatium japonicum]QIK36806.1 methyltransferase domain-containing protein [Caldichromatium japonicum]
MNDRFDTGYVQDVAFRSGVVPGQSPAAMNGVALARGYLPPRLDRPFGYLDLGCGEGTTLLALAALYPEGRFFGVDFNPAHIAAANRAKAALGLDNLTFFEAPFVALPELPLPERFDYIASNGIYGWLDPANAAAVDAFVGAHLAPGGLFYVEYLSQPGKVAIAALWRFLQKMTPLADFGGDARARAEAALTLLERLARRGMAFFQQHPSALAAARHYLAGKKRDAYQIDHFAHNAMAEHFTPRAFDEIAARFAPQGLTFVGRADLELNDLELAVPPAQVPTFREFADPVRRELLMDFIRNEHDRRDLWGKELTADAEAASARLAAEYGLLLRVPPEKVVRQIAAPGGHAVALIGPHYDAWIAAGYDAVVRLPDAPAERTRLVKPFVRLAASGQAFLITAAAFAPRPAAAPKPEAPLSLADAINRHLIALNAARATGCQLVAPATGGMALLLAPLEVQLLAAAADRPWREAPAATLAALQALGETPILAGEGFRPAREVTLADLEKLAADFAATRAINLARLGLLAEAA